MRFADNMEEKQQNARDAAAQKLRDLNDFRVTIVFRTERAVAEASVGFRRAGLPLGQHQGGFPAGR
jgi:hypothetical protein